MSKKDTQITVTLSELENYKDKDKVGGFPVFLAFFAIIFCLLTLAVISRPGSQPSQNNTVIVK